MGETVDRYEGKPMLRLLDAFVLDSMGMLDDATRTQVEGLASELPRILGTAPGTWQECVTEAMGLPPDAAQHIHRFWRSTLARAEAAGVEPDPVEFAHFIADRQSSGEDA